MITFVSSAAQAPAAPGAYALWLRLDHLTRITVGGRPSLLRDGDYIFFGSAKGPGGLRARLARHWRREKSVRWQIDQLTVVAKIRGAWIEQGGDEFELNAALGALPTPAPGFGSADCRRRVSHLRQIGDLDLLPAALGGALAAGPHEDARRAFRLLRKPDPEDDPSVDQWIRVMCDHCCDGVWNRAGAACSVEDLPVSTDLRARLLRWQATHDAHDDHELGLLADDAFVAEGLAIARAVKAQLRDWTVVYHDEKKFAVYLEAKGDYLNRPRAVPDFEYEILLDEPADPEGGDHRSG